MHYFFTVFLKSNIKKQKSKIYFNSTTVVRPNEKKKRKRCNKKCKTFKKT